MLILILSHTPLWVWGLLAGLLLLGFVQSRERQLRRLQLLALPAALLLLGATSLAGAASAVPALLPTWLVALALGAALGSRIAPPAGARWLAERQRLQLPGSWWPMVLIVVIFLLRYSSNVGLALHPEWRTQPAVQLPLGVAFGLLSGVFLGRAMRLLRWTYRPVA